ncbi:MAG: carbohydrate kinase family protein [Myxococcales bacterium]|nr:carbohydrate kinase family protein [Myxococcales bacterium]
MTRAAQILVIGGASVDTLRAGDGKVTTPGGGALFTAVAARKAGGDVGFFGFRPEPLPELFERVASKVQWVGPPCQLSDIPHFDIVYDEAGNARMAHASWGNEDTLAPEMLPDYLLGAEFIHLAAIADASLQMRFIDYLRPRSKARISAGTFGYMALRSPDAVRALMDACDVFFLNAHEAELVFGGSPPIVRPGQILVVTRGADGADVWQGDHCARVPICPAKPVDLTGAGDSLCGGMLAGLAAGTHPVAAARQGAAVAAVTIEAPGMTNLLESNRQTIDARWQTVADKRVRVDLEQVARIAEILRQRDDVKPFDFTGKYFPDVGDQRTVTWLFAAIKHQFGFWQPYNGVWHTSTLADWEGARLKGSDYCFAAFRRVLDRQPDILSPQGQMNLRWQDTVGIFRDDAGQSPLPVLATHHSLATAYGRDMWQLGWSPDGLLAEAKKQARPVRWLLQKLDHLPGYREDPLRKKAMLLVIALGQRPERFLDLGDDEDLAPIMDYHLMRSCLRTGLVRVDDDELRAQLTARKLMAPKEESAVRAVCYDAVLALSRLSGCSIAAIDWFFFGARRRCPELAAPDCAHCAIDPGCAHDIALFQPVYRTTFY